MKTIYTTLFAILMAVSSTFAIDNTKDIPTASAKADNKESKEAKAESNSTSANSASSTVSSAAITSAKTTKVISGEDLHKLKFPKKFATKKTKYNFRRK